MKQLLLAGGTMGVGKTAVCRQLKKRLLLAGSWCWDAAPFRETEKTKAMVLDNIVHLLNNVLQATPMRRFPSAGSWNGRTSSTASFPLWIGCIVLCVSLTADAAGLRARLSVDIAAGLRNPDAWKRRAARLSPYQALNALSADTCGKSAQMVCAEAALRRRECAF